MTKSVSVRFSDVEHKALEAKAEELDKTPQDLIKEALEAYGALAPDEGFNLRLRAHLRDILGFSSSEGLEAFILSTLQSVTPPNPGETYEDRRRKPTIFSRGMNPYTPRKPYIPYKHITF